MANMFNFTCPICGKNYDNAVEMANCVIECDKKQAEMNVAKNTAAQKIMDAYDNIKNMIEEFNSLYPNDSFSFTLTRGSVKNAGDKNAVKDTAKPVLNLESFFEKAKDIKTPEPKFTKKNEKNDLFTILDELFKVY